MYNKEATQEWRRKHRKQHLTTQGMEKAVSCPNAKKDKVDYASSVTGPKDGHGDSRTSPIQIEQEKQGPFENESPAIA